MLSSLAVLVLVLVWVVLFRSPVSWLGWFFCPVVQGWFMVLLVVVGTTIVESRRNRGLLLVLASVLLCDCHGCVVCVVALWRVVVCRGVL